MTRTVEEIILEIDKRLKEINETFVEAERDISICKSSLSGGRYELRVLLDWIKSEKEE